MKSGVSGARQHLAYGISSARIMSWPYGAGVSHVNDSNMPPAISVAIGNGVVMWRIESMAYRGGGIGGINGIIIY